MSLSRRRFVQGTAVATGTALLTPAVAQSAQAAGSVTVSAAGVTLVGQTDGSLLIQDGAGGDRVLVPYFMLKDSVLGQQRTFGGTPTLITLADGRSAIQMAYVLSSAAPGVTVTGVFAAKPNQAELSWTVAGSSTLTPTGFMVGRTVSASTAAETYEPVTVWNRDTGGGVPYETNAGVTYVETWADMQGFFYLAATTPAYTNATWMHAPGTSTGSDSAATSATLVLGGTRPRSAGAIATGAALGVDAWTDQPFNLWNTPGAAMTLNAQVANGSAASQPVTVTWFAKDFAGQQLAGGTLSTTIAAGAVWNGSFPVTGPAQGIVFTEVQAVAGSASAFARTNLAVLPDFAYQGGSTSMFGLANYPWLLKPNQAAVLGLLKTMGIKWIRNAYSGAPGIDTATLDANGILHNVELGAIPLNGTAAQISAWADASVATCTSSGAKHFEVGNELNQPWMSGQGADVYVRGGLQPIHDRLTAAGSAVKVSNCGLGGMDYNWTANFYAAGGWPLIDAFAIHPGRGNFTADYAPDPSTWTQGGTGTYWNFYGAVTKARQIVDTYGGGKALWLTEAYAPTRPNVWWSDTYRTAAENIVLSLALAKVQGVELVQWYQLHDSTIHHPQEADPTDVEYHSGLMMRDTSPKPSMLAYATVARALDQATFLRPLSFSDPLIKGLVFTTPNGPVSILWSRHDGYVLNADHGTGTGYATPEAWTDVWPTKTQVSVHAGTASGTVTVADCIGRQSTLRASNYAATLTLDGAPRIVWGLAANADWKTS